MLYIINKLRKKYPVRFWVYILLLIAFVNNLCYTPDNKVIREDFEIKKFIEENIDLKQTSCRA